MLFTSLTAFACGLFIVGCVGLEAIRTDVADDAEINQFTTSFQDAYNAHDPLLVAGHYTEDARWMAAAGLVIDGRPMITQFLQQFMIFVPPMLTLTEGEKIVVGNYAVTHGAYTMSDGVDGSGRSIGGSYMNVLHKEEDGWHIVGQQMNYGVAMSPLMWVGSIDAVTALPEAGTLGWLAAAYEASYNAGDIAALTTLFAADAWVSFGGSSPVTGRDAVTQAIQARIGNDFHLTLHDVSTLPLSDEMAVDVGWYELVADDNRVQWGTYTLLAQQNSDGEWQIHWFVDTGSPLSVDVR
ncbi:DUF4440 domain-containing protein [Chloroflexi bacterium TSY]|nr:DUF4440 domain-containing protein [Chloroflexi bacterium TSY]